MAITSTFFARLGSKLLWVTVRGHVVTTATANTTDNSDYKINDCHFPTTTLLFQQYCLVFVTGWSNCGHSRMTTRTTNNRNNTNTTNNRKPWMMVAAAQCWWKPWFSHWWLTTNATVDVPPASLDLQTFSVASGIGSSSSRGIRVLRWSWRSICGENGGLRLMNKDG